MHGKLEAEIPAHELVLGGGAPQYTRPYTEPEYFEKIKAFDADSIPDAENLQAVAEQMIRIHYCIQTMDICTIRQYGGHCKYNYQCTK